MVTSIAVHVTSVVVCPLVHRVDLDRLRKIGKRKVGFSDRAMGQAAIVVSIGVRRIDLKRLRVIGYCLTVFASICVDVASVLVRPLVLRVELNRFAKVRDRRCQITLTLYAIPRLYVVSALSSSSSALLYSAIASSSFAWSW